MAASYDRNVFVNCPFDDEYAPLFRAIVFSVHDCGFVVRSALEEADSGRVRVEKISQLIAESRLSVHDVSRTELDAGIGLPRFNMPFELGVVMGATWFGTPKHKRKQCLVLDREPYRYRASISDIAGQDIRAHSDEPAGVITAVRNWLSHFTDETLPGPKAMAKRYALFASELPDLLGAKGIEEDELIYNDLTTFVVGWLQANPRP